MILSLSYRITTQLAFTRLALPVLMAATVLAHTLKQPLMVPLVLLMVAHCNLMTALFTPVTQMQKLTAFTR
jgi:hypothetical protein